MAEETHCYVHVVHHLQIMIASEGMMKCGGCFEKVKLSIREYQLKLDVFPIEMGGCNVMLTKE